MKAAAVLSSVALGTAMAFAASILPSSPWDADGEGRRPSQEIRIAQAPGTPTPAPTPRHKTLNFGGAGQN